MIWSIFQEHLFYDFVVIKVPAIVIEYSGLTTKTIEGHA